MINEQAIALGTNRSVIRDLFDYGNMRAAIVGRENVFDFSIGNPSEPVPEAVSRAFVEVLQEDSLSVHGYTSAPGLVETRQAIADDLNHRYNAGVEADDLFISTGASAELAAVIKALVTPGAEFLVIAPYFPEYKPFIEGNGGVMRIVPPDIPDFQISLEAVEAQLSPNTAAILLNSPCNPTGTVFTAESLENVKQAILGRPIFLICDNVYNALSYVNCPDLSLDPQLKDQTILCQSFSKPWAMTGWRVGYLTCPDYVMDRLLLLSAAEITAVPTFLQDACIAALSTSPKPMADAYAKRREYVCRRLDEMGLSYPKPEGAFYVFPDISKYGLTGEEFCTRMIRETKVAAVPGSCFGCPGHIRISCCCSDSQLALGLDRMEAFINKLSQGG